MDIRNVKTLSDLTIYFSEELGWDIDPDDFVDIEDITYDFSAEDIGLKEEAFAKIDSLQQLPALVDGQKWGIFFVEFESNRFEVSALRKILSGLVPKRRNSEEHAVWDQQDLVFLCTWGENNNRTIGIAHFEDKEKGLPQIKMISCAPAMEDFTQINVFKDRLKKLSWPTDPNDTDSWRESWSDAFISGYRQTIQDSATLTVKLAAEAQNIRDRILEIIDIESANGYVHLLYEKFKNTLIADMTEKQFADMYAQTVVYGLFSARCMDDTQEDFSAAEAVECIPNTNPFLKSLMQECLGTQNTSKLSFDELEIENVVDLLRNTKTDAIIQDFNRQTGGGKEDPVIHFYEEFLTAYDKDQKVQRGVFYTPQPIVNFIVRAVDDIIKTEFGLEDGIASENTKIIDILRQSKKRNQEGGYNIVRDKAEVPAIQVLDPATGTGTFLRQIILQIYDNFKNKHKDLRETELKTAWNDYVPKHLLPRLNGFEIMMAPYAVAHMKLAMVLKETGYTFENEHRFQLFLTNTLEEPGDTDMQTTMFEDPLAIESLEANTVKKNKGINIVIGNPPYSTESANKGEWIGGLMESFKMESDGTTKLQEKNSKPLNDDYVKFIRYSQFVLDNSASGIVAFINPHGYLDGPIFRGMRASLMRSFDAIYIIDLHGNANRKEQTPEGGKDENVFDIKQGVCISILVKKNNNVSDKGEVFHYDVYGLRDKKYEVLLNTSWEDIKFEHIQPVLPDCVFKKVDRNLQNEYEQGISVNELFLKGANGIKTARDKFTLGFSEEEVIERMEAFRKLDVEDARNRFSLGKDVQEWQVGWAQKDLNENAVTDNKINKNCIIPICYRVFDYRYLVFTGVSCGILGRPRTDITNQFVMGQNIGLATGRTNKTPTCDHFLAVDHMIEMKCAERSTCAAVFPLYSYYVLGEGIEKSINLDKTIIASFAERVGLEYIEGSNTDNKAVFNEYDLFCYIYACLYSRSYREKYADLLKADFPRIPYCEDSRIFWSLKEKGELLINLHTFKQESDLAKNETFLDNGRIVQKARLKNNRVYINNNSYFEEVELEDWEMIIGGYAPLQYWFKDRKEKELSEEEIVHYKAMISVVKQTRGLMDEIDSTVRFA